MSKLMQAIATRQTGHRWSQMSSMPCVDIYDEIVPNRKIEIKDLLEYRCEVVIGGYFYAEDAEDLAYQQEKLRYKLVDSVYGEFREGLYELHKAISRGDRKEALKCFDEVFNQMFGR